MTNPRLGPRFQQSGSPLNSSSRSGRVDLRVACVTAFAALLSLLAACSPFRTEFDPETPAPVPSELPPLPVQISTFRLPLSVPIGTLETLLQDALPMRQRDRHDGVLDAGVAQINLSWSASRGQISLSATEAGALALGTGVDGSATLELEPLLGPSATATVEMEGALSATASPELEPGWRVRPNLSGSVVLDEAVHRVFNLVDVSLRTVVQPRVNRLVGRQIRSLEDRLRRNDFLERGAREGWAALCKSVPLPLEPPHWLEVRPRAAIAVQPRVDGENIHFLFGLEAETRIGQAPVEAECVFPEELRLEETSQGLSEIALPVDVSYEALESALLELVRGRTVDDRVSVSVSNVKLRPYGRALLLEVVLNARVGGWTGARAGGTLYLAAEPVLDPEAQVVRLENLRLDTASRNILIAALGEAVEPVILAFFEGRKLLELDPAWRELSEKANSGLAELGTETVNVTGGLEEIRLAGLDVGPESVRVVVLATGRVGVAVEVSLEEL